MKIFLAILSLLVASAPTLLAHTDGGIYGTPKPYCENMKGDQNVHDYVTIPSMVTYPLADFRDGNLEDCNGDNVVSDYDGHSEWALGGAFLLTSEAGAPISGATTCYGEAAHHPTFPDVWVFDHFWPSGVLFLVAADTTNLPITDPSTGITTDCGDAIDDVDTGYCVDHCTVGFAPGVDGAYHVYVVSTLESAEVDPQIHFHWAPDDGICFEGAPGRWMCIHTNLGLRLAALGHIYT